MGACCSLDPTQKHIVEQRRAVAEAVKLLAEGAEQITCNGRNLRNQGTIDLAKKLGERERRVLDEGGDGVRTLELRSNEIGDAGVKELALSLRYCSSLQVLDLSSNCIGSIGVSCLGLALEENATLTTLCLSSNRLGDLGAARLSDTLAKNAKLKKLFLEKNQITSRGAASLGQGLANNVALEVLWMLDNPIGYTGAISFANAMDGVNSSLKKFGFTVDSQQMSTIVEHAAHLKPNNVVRQAVLTMAESQGGGLGNKTQDGPGGIYHEQQQGSLCAMHCLNNLLQGPYFTEWQLNKIASSLDLEESRLVGVSGMADSGNADAAGFNVQVICEAMRSVGCEIELVQVTTSQEALQHPDLLQGFICNQSRHWFALRRIGDDWYDLNSVLDEPIKFSQLELREYLNDALAGNQSMFLVRGDLRHWEKQVEAVI